MFEFLTDEGKSIICDQGRISVDRMWRVLRSVAFVTYKEWAAYRSHMAVSLFVGPVLFLVQVFIWSAVFTGRETVQGLTLNQMITYYAVVAVINYFIL